MKSIRLPEILMFHHVEPEPLDPPPLHPNSYLTSVGFESLLDRLVAGGWQGVSLAQALERAAAGRRPGRTVVLTFDDGCRCFAEHAAPALAARGFSATLYAVAGSLGGSNHWDATAGERGEDLLDATGLCALAGAGFEIGCHGAGHLDLTTLDEAGLRAETAGAKARLEAELGRPVTTFCYPYGRWNEPARRAVEAAGFAAAVGIVDHGPDLGQADRGQGRGDRFALPRWPVGPGESAFETGLKVSGRYRLWRRLPRLGLLSALRRKSRRS